jgi:hypothetical protein
MTSIKQPHTGIQDADALLLEREVRGLQFILGFRLMAVLIMVSIHFFVGKSIFEKVTVAVLTVLVVASSLWFFSLLRQRKFVRLVGIAGAVSDCVVLALLPFIWHESVGGGDTVPTSYMLKTPTHLSMAFSYVMINCFAARAIYPLIVTVGASVVRVGIYLLALADARVVFSEDFLDYTFGASVRLCLQNA